ncbi:MAG TPA: hypothetical protein VMW65_08760, partial [Chloroflexota bacterium]|nr:hypothetical protein [Chloroflexota bacterium]
LMRHESTWLKRRPSEYLPDHVRFTTQPLEESPQRQQLVEALEACEGLQDILCFSSDYPHWDADSPHYIAGRLPRSWHPKVFYENVRQFFRWPTPRINATGVLPIAEEVISHG